MKKIHLQKLAVVMAATFLIAVFCSPAVAKVTGVCGNCHTMHNSQDDTAVASGGLHATLLMNSCVGCHSSVDSSTTYSLGECTVPVVNYIGGSAPTDYLAGGNFYWVATEGAGRTDAKGHNVFTSNPDDILSSAPGGVVDCNGCHGSLATASSGCRGCHRKPAHHADDSATVIGATNPSTDGYYRFLSAHNSSAGGVCGIEDPDWQAAANATDHNEYLGNAINLNASANMNTLGHTMTGFCCGCHGDFHAQNTEPDGSGSWIRHPSDAKIPITGEYAAYVLYDPLAPVARPDLTDWTGPSSSVNEAGTVSKDMVMCLSCHRPHGSPHDDMLRWDYNEMVAGGGANTTGCFTCHTDKSGG